MPDYLEYHKSLNAELTAIKDRVRSLIKHWPTDGSFKESLLRNMLRRHLPESLFIGTGFIVAGEKSSKQIDVLVVDKNCPRLFWDGDLVIVTPDAVRAVIEVKTGLDRPAQIESVILKAAEDRAIWYRSMYGCNNISALFVYEDRGNHEEAILQALRKARQQYNQEPDCVVYGNDVFIDMPGKICDREFQGWVSQRTEGMAAACLISKLIGRFSEMSVFSNQSAWQPLMKRDSILKYLPRDGRGSIERVPLEDCRKRHENQQ